MIESHRFQQGSLMRVKNKTTPDSWLFRYYVTLGGQRKYRNRKIGSVKEYPHLRDAQKAVLALRAKINSEVRSPETVNDLIAHYLKNELTTERKAFATVEVHRIFIERYIRPKWGVCRLSEVRTVAVEQWLESLPLARASQAKIRNIMSAMYSHGIRHEWIALNPITGVRTSAQRLRQPDVLTSEEFQSLLAELGLREQVMVLVAGSTGLRRSELIALTWADVNFLTMEIAVIRSCVRNHFGNVKTEASKKPVPIHPPVGNALLEWRKQTPYGAESDFLFPSIRLNGKQPVSPDTVLKKIIRPALKRAGIEKRVGWHTFRHSLATNLRSLGVDIKTAQELLRHANSRITMDFYTQAVSSEKRLASGRIMDMLLAPKDSALEVSTV
jgi:integrase